MDLLDKEVIFSKSFPKLNIDGLDDVDLKGYETDLGLKKVDAASFLENFNKKFVYIPRPDAERRTEEFTSLATKICENFEIDTEYHELNIQSKYQ